MDLQKQSGIREEEEMIYFDIDGVIRNLDVTFEDDFSTWESFTDKHMHMIYDNPKKHLEDAPVFLQMKAFIDTFHDTFPIVFLTCSDISLRIYTERFIQKHFPFAYIEFFDKPEDKLKHISEEDFLVDDYPYYSDDRVILVEREYNKKFADNYKIVWRMN